MKCILDNSTTTRIRKNKNLRRGVNRLISHDKMKIVPDTEEGGYVALFSDLPGCITVGDTIEEAIENIIEAKKLG